MTLLQLTTIIFLVNAVTTKDIWQKPGCHKVGHTRKIDIPNCIQFSITTNACRGYCESYAVPSAPVSQLIQHNNYNNNINNYINLMNNINNNINGIKPLKPVTSVGQCCNIMQSEDVHVHVNCLGGPKNITFKSATKCLCYHCKKD